MKTLTALLLPFIVVTCAFAQTEAWKMKLTDDFKYATTSEKSSHLLLVNEQGDNSEIVCVNPTSGAVEWKRTLKDFEQYRMPRFLGEDTVLVGQENRYEFLNARDGSVLATIPIAAKSWDDLEWATSADPEYDTLAPHVENGIGIYYFEYGMQFLDLTKASLIYQTGWRPNKVKYYRWGSVLMVNPVGGGDTIYFLDMTSKKLVYKISKYDNDINASIYQPFAVSLSELLLFNEGDIVSVDLETGQKNATIPVDPDNPDYYTPLVFKEGLYLMVSDDDVQKMYRTKDAKLMWQTEPGAIKGIVEQAVELPNDEAMLVTYEPGGRTAAYKVSTSTGKILWSRPLFFQEGKLEPGHKEGSRFLATLGAIAMYAAKSYLNSRLNGGYFNSYRRDPYTGMVDHTDFYNQALDRQRREDSRMLTRQVNETYNSWVNKKKSTEGYASLLGQHDNQATFALVGKIYEPTKSFDNDTYNGEGIVTINTTDGSITKALPFPMLALSEKGKFNAYTDMNVQQFDSAAIMVGVHDVFVLRGDNLERITFGEDAVGYINSGPKEVTIQVNHEDEQYDYYRINVAEAATRRYLLARSYVPNIVFRDSTVVSTTLRVTEDSIQAFPLVTMTGSEPAFGTPKWTLTDKDLDRLDVGSLKKNMGSLDSLQGIQISGSDVYLMGDDGLGFVSADGSCRWSYEWSPQRLKMLCGVTRVGDATYYSTGGHTAILHTQCPSSKVADHDVSQYYTRLYTTPGGTLMMLDSDNGVVYGYRLK